MTTTEANSPLGQIPLCVDLDNTLLRTDLLFESFVAALKRHPTSVLLTPFWLLKGRAFLKQQIARRGGACVRDLPIRDELLEFLRVQRRSGRRLVLVSAAAQPLASVVGERLDLFDEVLGSNGTENLKGPRKARLLEEKFGRGGFDYIGDSRSDFAVWRSARHALVVSDRPRFVDAIRSIVPVEAVFRRSHGKLKTWMNALRLHQWSKNLLVFVPVLTSHRLFENAVLFHGFVAFFSFSLFCSGMYLVNDLVDLEADRRHETKRLRPLASGELSIASAIVSAPLLLIAGLALASLGGFLLMLCLGAYGAASLTYTLWFKRVVMLDVVVLACLYSVRLFAGGAATGIYCSEWLLAFSVFFFFCLATVKRYSELRTLPSTDESPAPGRGYLRSDLEVISALGSSSGLISVLVLILYIMSPEVRLLYHHRLVLLLLCPLFLYWTARIWFKAHRGEVPEDPVVFALSDRTSYFTGALTALVLYVATI